MAAKSGAEKELVDYLEEKVTCPLCYERYHHPRSLPCLHTLCTPCLEAHVAKTPQQNKYTCPVCRAQVDLPIEGVYIFITIFRILSCNSGTVPPSLLYMQLCLNLVLY